MRKKSDKELGVVLPESMVDAIDNKALTDVQIGQLVRAILWNSMEYSNDVVVATLARTLVSTYRGTNSARLRKIKDTRQSKAEYERKRREKANIVEEAILKTVKKNMEFHGTHTEFHGISHVRTCANAENKKSEKERSKEKDKSTKDIPPIKSPHGGDKKSSSAKAEGRAHTGSPTTRGRRTGQTVAKGRDGAGSARPTARSTTSGDSRERPAPSSKETGGGRCRWMDAEGFCTSEKMQGGGFKCIGCENREPIGADGAAPAKPGARTLLGTGRAIKGAAQRMMDAHPNAKSGERAVVRALAQTIEDEGGDAEVTLGRIDKAHAAWCATDGWSAENCQYVMALDKWIRNGGWRKLPPQKKKAPPQKGDEMSFGASL